MAWQDKLAQRPFLVLACSIVLEVCATTCMKMSEGFTVPLYSVICIVAMFLSLGGLVIVLKKLPLGLTYGIWGGVGTALTTLIGILVWNDPFNATIVVGISLVVVGIVLLNKGQKQHQQHE